MYTNYFQNIHTKFAKYFKNIYRIYTLASSRTYKPNMLNISKLFTNYTLAVFRIYRLNLRNNSKMFTERKRLHCYNSFPLFVFVV